MARIDPADAPRAVREYLDTLDEAAFGAASEVQPKFTSHSNPASQWMAARKGLAFFSYSDNYLIDTDHGVIVDVEATRSIQQTQRGSLSWIVEAVDVFKDFHLSQPAQLFEMMLQDGRKVAEAGNRYRSYGSLRITTASTSHGKTVAAVETRRPAKLITAFVLFHSRYWDRSTTTFQANWRMSSALCLIMCPSRWGWSSSAAFGNRTMRFMAEVQVRIAVLNGYAALGIPITKTVG